MAPDERRKTELIHADCTPRRAGRQLREFDGRRSRHLRHMATQGRDVKGATPKSGVAVLRPSAHGPCMAEQTSSRHEIEEGAAFLPTFDRDGLIPAVTVDHATGRVLMVAWMSRAALDATLATGIVHYWSRSRGELWRKGDTSGQTQTLIEMRVDCDQDTLLLRVTVGGDGGCCHTGRRACFYRRVERNGSLSFIDG